MGSSSGFSSDGDLGEIQFPTDRYGNASGSLSIAQRQANILANLGVNGGTVSNPITGQSASGTLVVPGTAAPNQLVVLDSNASISGMVINPNLIDATAATLTLTAQNNGATVLLDKSAGVTVTLPAATPGLHFKFIVKTVSTAHKIITSAGTIFIAGGIFFDKSLTISRYDGNTTTLVSINFNGTTTGGATAGDTIEMDCVSSTLWTVSGTVTASGTLATPFATS